MQGSRASERNHDELPRVDAALHRHHAQRIGHRGVGDLHDAVGAGDGVELHVLGATPRNAVARGVDAEPHLPAQEIGGVEPAQRQVGIGDGGLLAAVAVADRPRIGTRALRPDAQDAARVDPGDAAAAGADLDQVDHGSPNGIAAGAGLADPGIGLRADLVFLGDPGLAVQYETHLGGGAAHVERNHVGMAKPAGDVVRDDHPRGRTRLHHVRGLLGAGLEGEHPAARLHDEQLGIHAGAAQPVLDVVEVAGQDGAHARVDDGGAGAEVLAELRAHVGGERDDQLLVAGAQQLADALLVDRVQVAVKQADRDRDHVLLGQCTGDFVNPVFVQGLQHGACRVEPLIDLEAEIARHEWPRLLEVDVVEVRPDLAADLQHVAEALGGDERGPWGLALDQGVGGDGGAVDEVGDGVRRDVALGENAFDRVQEAPGRIRRSGGDLRDSGRPGVFGEQHGIGEGTADVHANPELSLWCSIHDKVVSFDFPLTMRAGNLSAPDRGHECKKGGLAPTPVVTRGSRALIRAPSPATVDSFRNPCNRPGDE